MILHHIFMRRRVTQLSLQRTVFSCGVYTQPTMPAVHCLLHIAWSRASPHTFVHLFFLPLEKEEGSL